MQTLLFLTSSFPYEGGEQFIEEEIRFWSDTEFDRVYLLPSSRSDVIRSYPGSVGLLEANVNRTRLFYAIRALFGLGFYKEVFSLVKVGKFSFQRAFIACKNMAIIIKIRDEIRSCLKEIEGDHVFIYSYWDEAATYAACLLKKEGKVCKVFSRAHRFDLYEEGRAYNYMPYKRQFVKYIDKVFLLSQSALDYYAKTYGVKKDSLAVARLGVKINYDVKKVVEQKLSGRNEINLLSVSYCVPVKQIDKIMEGVVDFSRKNKDKSVKWVHIGSGKLFEKLKKAAQAINREEGNLFIDFLGQKTNAEVHSFLRENRVDVFINGSASEGIPVSIMEAMSYEIAVVAPDVGSVSDLVNNENGVLLSRNYSVTELSDAIALLSDEEIRVYKSHNAREWVGKYFDSEKNYTCFIEQLQAMCKK